ncbi:DUF6456 domain-containing protein [Aliishimia ponticola]
MSDTPQGTAHGDQPEFEQEAKRILRRLCESGSVLAIAADMDTAVVVREGPDGATTRTAVVSQEIAQAMAVQGWIETSGTGRILRYRITQAGRDKVRDLLDQEPARQAPVFGMAEAPAGFDGAAPVGEPANSPAATSSRRNRYSLSESPLTVLARRRDKSGDPFLSDDLVRCGERLREDFELAQMEPSMSQNWDKFLTAGIDEGRSGAGTTGYGPAAARARVMQALSDLGPGLSDVALYCCCYLEGLESTEKRMGWSARSGKIVLRIALQRLKRHYEENLTPEAQLIG